MFTLLSLLVLAAYHHISQINLIQIDVWSVSTYVIIMALTFINLLLRPLLVPEQARFHLHEWSS